MKKLIIENDKQQEFLEKHGTGTQVRVHDTRQNPNWFLFCGRIEAIVCEQESDFLIADVYAVSYSADLERGKRSRSFQNTNVTFKQVVKQVAEVSGANFIWEAPDRKTNQPFIQLESDWDFLVRLASRFNLPIQGSLFSEYPVFYFGVRDGRKRILDEAKIMEYGFSREYYSHGGYATGQAHKAYRFLKVRHLESWEVGDYVWFQKQKFTVVERLMRFDETGELFYVDMLGAEGLIYRPAVYNEELVGMQIEGTVVDVEHESVFIRFCFDDEDGNYPWKWVPEIGNIGYIMPEKGTRMMLTLSSADEKDGLATHVLRRNGTYPSENHRGLSTPHGKHIKLYPDLIAFETEESSISMIDEQGIQINSNKDITMNAQGSISISGEQIFVQAPDRILMQTSQSNIEMCKNFNIYAPSGVTNSGTGEDSGEIDDQEQLESTDKYRKEDLNHWQVSYAALGTVLNANSGFENEDDAFIRLFALGSVPRISGGHVIVSMSEVMKGIPIEETTFPEAITKMQAYTFDGGFYMPPEEGNGD